MKIRNLRIGFRLGLSFGIIALLLAAIAGLTVARITHLADEIDTINNNRYPKTVLVHSIKDELNETARNTRNLLLMTEPAQVKGELDNIANSSKVISAAMQKLDDTITSDIGRGHMAALHAARAKFLAARDAFLQQRALNDMEKSHTMLFADVRPAQIAYMDELDRLVAYQDSLMRQAGEESAEAAQQTRNFVLIIALCALATSGIVGWYATRSITRPLANAVVIARRVADGDLTSDIHIASTDETGQLLAALRDMNDGLLKIVAQVRTGTELIATASTEIASGNLDLSSRTEEQASSLEETASAMEQLTSAVKQNADHAVQANQLAATASAIAEQGGNVVGEVVSTMNSISESSKKIVDIIGVIDGIAFQTNILALNAAVEAARAGEQGRGFAVVASEVRNLAQRSATAAREIKALIADSVEKVSSGTALVQRAGTTMGEVVTSVKHVSDVVGEITAAGREQNTGIEEINHALTQMDHVTQQNAALVEEAAAAAASLQQQAADLSKLVSVFKLLDRAQMPAATLPATTLSVAKSSATAPRSPHTPARVTSVAVKPALGPSPRTRLSAVPAPALAQQLKTVTADEDSWETY